MHIFFSVNDIGYLSNTRGGPGDDNDLSIEIFTENGAQDIGEGLEEIKGWQENAEGEEGERRSYKIQERVNKTQHGFA